jgi:23S rRNA (guanosine2251-2'-O)-methyltransferase
MKRLLLGPRAVTEGLRAAPARIAVVYVSDEVSATAAAVLKLAREHLVRCETRERAELDLLAKGDRHQGVLAVAGEYSYFGLEDLLAAIPEQNPILVALDQVTDPHNFGAIIRSAVALGADGIVTLKDRAAPVTSAVVRASAGATEMARIARVVNLARTLGELEERGLQVVGLDASAEQELQSLSIGTAGRVLVIGSEGRGLRRLVRDHCSVLARIELSGPVSSLNASVAAGIAVYESIRQRQRSRHAPPQQAQTPEA